MKIVQQSLYEQIADRLKDMILSGELKEGDKIKEDQLCASMEISKTPLREALKVLRAEGLIKLIPNRGSFVSKPTFEEIKEMFDVMGVLEGVCAHTATEKMTPRTYGRLQQLHEQLEAKVAQNDRKAYIRINDTYHSLVQELAGNKTLNNIINGLRQKILLYRFQSLSLNGRLSQSIQEHRELLDAFQQGDAERAETLMRHHLKMQFKALEILTHSNPATTTP